MQATKIFDPATPWETLAEKILVKGLASPSSITPSASLIAMIADYIMRKGTSELAFTTGAAPITLIDSDKAIEVLSVDAEAFAELELEA